MYQYFWLSGHRSKSFFWFSIAPAVLARAFGGLTYYQALELIRGVANRGPIVGFDVVEVVPALDPNGLTSFLAARLTLATIGAMARAGQFRGR